MRAALAVALIAGALSAQGQVPPDGRGRVFVVGEATVTSVPCSEEMTLSRVLAVARPKATAALESVALLRMDDRGCGIAVVDAAEVMREGSKAWDCAVNAGDVLYLPKQPGPRDKPWTTVALREAALAPMLASGVGDPRRAWLQTQLLMHSTDRAVRQQMALDLAHGPDPRLGVQQLVSVLDLDPSIAREAVTALGTMGGAAKAALPELERLREHPDLQLRTRVLVAIRQIEGRSRPH